ncbi:helix-turn-helix domain-containing protein [Ralstonia sp. NFACC01]|uniref:MarR family transcriptional regulator n=1 Tax=Ralstonia sp. NFACC01 TaxID=1566294 RepID=UPI0008F32611|nr:helix-turn-helix domain-containing protein [Ralstonia sp. NFACC01]SFO86290.1 hypothetical protein SAMN03159417_00374 [Ralstonia sp. NFACC01]
MDWTALLKHLNLSRSVVTAAFVASAGLYVGNRLAPGYVPAAPEPWGFALVAVMLFTGTLLAIWLAQFFGKGYRVVTHVVTTWRSDDSLTPDQANMLLAVGRNDKQSLNIRYLDYERLPLSRLAVQAIADELIAKGLLEQPFASDRDFLQLTAAGRQRALDIERMQGA